MSAIIRDGKETLVTDPDYLNYVSKTMKKRGMMLSGGEINYERAAITVIDEFRSGKIGRITLELPPEKE